MWAVLEPLLPARDPRRGGRPRTYQNRPVLDAIFYVLRSGCQWRMIPHDLVPWWTAYRWYRTWAADGTWDAVHDALRALVRAAAGKDPHPSAGVLDAQSVKSSEGGAARGFDMAKKTTGRKRHLVVDTLGLVLVVMVTAACVQDRPGGKVMLARLAAAFPVGRAGVGRRRVRQHRRRWPGGLGPAHPGLTAADRPPPRRRQRVRGAAAPLGGGADLVRREALCRIPGSAGRDSEGGSWVEWLTWIRKVKGTAACQKTRRPGPAVRDGAPGGPA